MQMKEEPSSTAESHTYYSDQQVGWGFRVWREMVSELILSRELILRLFWRDFTAKYKQSVLGVLWALIMPLMMVGIFVFLNRSGILNIGETAIPYPLYALIGLTIWGLFAGGLISCANAIVSGGSLVVKVNFPKESLIIASFGQVIVETLVRIGLLALVFVFYRVIPCWTTLLLPFVLLPMILLTLGLGFFFSLLNVLVRDIANMLTLGTTFLLFLTPVAYPIPKEGIFAAVAPYNPLATLVGAARDVVITGYLKQPAEFAWISGFALVIFLISWRIFHLVEPRMAERL